MEKLGQLRRADEWDLIVVDTPPSRSALDFLDAPQRLGRFLDGRLIRLLTAPAKVGGRAYVKVLNAGFGMVTGVLTKVIGAQLLRDVQTFVIALDTMFGGFRERAEDTYRLLQAPGTAFLVIATPEPDALREASYFVERLAADQMPLAGLVVNRVHRSAAPQLSAARSLAAAETLQACAGAGIGAAAPARGGRAAAARGADAAGRAGTPAGGELHRGPPGHAGGRSAGAARGRARPRRAARGRGRTRPGVTARQATLPAKSQTRAARRCDQAVSWRRARRPAPLVLVTGALQQLAPRRHVGAAAEQRPALALGHATPDAELDAVVQRIGQALGADSAAAADQLGPVLRRALNEELVRISSLARGAGGPVRDPHVAHSS